MTALLVLLGLSGHPAPVEDRLFTTGVSLSELIKPGDLSAGAVLPYTHSAHWDLDSHVVVHRGRHVDLTEVIETAARRENLDPLLVKLVVQQESCFDPAAKSYVGAAGLMQLMPDTAKDLGCKDSLDPVQNVNAGTAYLASMYRHYGNLDLALAAYNAGPGNVDYYGGVPPFEETQHYVDVIANGYRAQKESLR